MAEWSPSLNSDEVPISPYRVFTELMKAVDARETIITHDFDLDDLIRILAACPEYEPGHPLGQPFMSAYQIAIRFAQAQPNHPIVASLDVGGEGTGARQSLAQRIARFLSAAAQDPGSGIEGGFISHQDIEAFVFDNDGSPIRVSGLPRRGHSIFRLKARI